QFQMEIPFRANGLAYGDSLMFYASPEGEATAFQLVTGEQSYTITAMDFNHWVLCRGYTQKDVVLTQALASDHSVFLTWESFDTIPNFAGYLVFRQAAGEPTFSLITANPIATTFYLDGTAQNGIQYSYMVQAVDFSDYRTMGSNVLSATPIEFAFDWGLLVVDETRDGNGAAITPDDAMVDSFYAAALTPIPYANWDYASLGAPSLNILSHYPVVLWHADDYAQNLIGDCMDVLGSYLMGNGKLIISGWKTAGSLSDSFRNLFLDGTELVYDNSAVLISAVSDIYPLLTPDPEKLTPLWNSMLPMVYTFQNATQPIYTANMTAGSAGANLPVAAKYENPGTLIVFGFPLYFMQAGGVRNLLQQLLPELHPELPNADDSQVPKPLTLSAYPNPFKANITLKFSQKLSPTGTLKVYNTKGQWITDIDVAAAKTSDSSLLWNAQDNSGQALSSGVYLLKYNDLKASLTRKVVLLK
ncbi:MAG: T9SS type A sorting domain-containing protein, partial [Candidatus Cloacimonadaceae bacterium]